MRLPPEFETIRIDVEGEVARLTLNRPEKLNPLSPLMLREIRDAAEWFDSATALKVVVVSGAGRAFSAGADLVAFQSGVDKTTRRQAAEAGREMAEALEQMRPLALASIHGWCIGGGMVLAAACDLRIAAADARFSIPEVDLGIGLAWGGIPRLVREVGPAVTKELVLTCREFGPEEARSIGFVNRVVAPERLHAEVAAMAGLLAKKAAFPLSITKRQVNAITDQVFGTRRAWADADAVLTALDDPECLVARRRYLAERGR